MEWEIVGGVPQVGSAFSKSVTEGISLVAGDGFKPSRSRADNTSVADNPGRVQVPEQVQRECCGLERGWRLSGSLEMELVWAPMARPEPNRQPSACFRSRLLPCSKDTKKTEGWHGLRREGPFWQKQSGCHPHVPRSIDLSLTPLQESRLGHFR